MPNHDDDDRFVDAGSYYRSTERGRLERAAPGVPDRVVCRRLVDYPGGRAPTGAAVGTCAECHAPIAYNPRGPHPTVTRICQPCAGIEPLPWPS